MGERKRRADSYGATTPPSVAVVEAVATEEGVTPTDLDHLLADVVDPDALDALFDPRSGDRANATLFATFAYCGHAVTVRGDGSVDVE